MAERQTNLTDRSAEEFLNTIGDEQKRQDAFAILELMQRMTGEPPRMWGSAIVGFGSHRMTYASGREADWMLIGFSPRKQNMTLYLKGDWERNGALLSGLGEYSCGKGCLYLKSLKGVDRTVLGEIIRASVERSQVRRTGVPQTDV